MMTVSIRLSENAVQHLQEMAGRESNVTALCREIVENAVADRRMRLRMGLEMPAHHYTARQADDYSDSE